MTETIDAVFRAVTAFTTASADVQRPLSNRIPEPTKGTFAGRERIFEAALKNFGGEENLITSNTSQAHTLKLECIKFNNDVLKEINLSHCYNDDLALFWPREPEAVSKEVIDFLEQSNCLTLAAIAKGAGVMIERPKAKASKPDVPGSP